MGILFGQPMCKLGVTALTFRMSVQKAFIGILFSLFLGKVEAQFGLQFEYQALNSPWEERLTEPDGKYLDQFAVVSAHYWFRLKNKRIEFLPQLSYATTLGSDALVPVTQNRISLFFNTDIYLFDLLNDCNCPTFSKQSGGFQRSFFFEVSPGVDYQMIKTKNFPSSENPNTEDAVTFRLGLGVGFDIGISDLLTITPIVHVDYGTRPDWTGLPLFPGGGMPTDVTGSEWLYRAGIRMTFRPDYVNRYR